MTDLYTSQSISGFNSSPPADDGTESEANRVFWSTIKSKLADPLNTFAAAINSEVNTAFGKVFGNAVVAITTNTNLATSHQGQLIKSTNAITLTLLAGATAGTNFVFAFYNNDSSNSLTLGRNSMNINNAASDITVKPGEGGIAYCDGTNWWVVRTANPANVLLAGTTNTLTVGYTITVYDNGTKSTGTFTTDVALGLMQKYTNGGAHTLAPPSGSGMIMMTITNNGSAGAITTSGFGDVFGDSFTTTNGHIFMCLIINDGTNSVLKVKALQ